MVKMLHAITCLILLCSTAESLEMKEKIVIYGAGSMNSITEIPNAKDSIFSNGDFQTYERSFNFEGVSSSFISNYTLLNNRGLKSSYLIAMNAGGERLKHIAKLCGYSDISSRSSVWKGIDKDESLKITTDFNITGQGKLNELVIDQNLNKYPTVLVNTEAEGEKVMMISGLSENAYGSEVDQAISKLPKKAEKIKSVQKEPTKKIEEYKDVAKPETPEANPGGFVDIWL